MINKDTIIYGSFSNNPGNNGNTFFNEKFRELNINAIYKSFYSDDIEKSIEAAKTLKFGGFAVSMPFKKKIIRFIDIFDESVTNTGSVNTVKIVDGKLLGFNTDYIGIVRYFENIDFESIYILGNGGMASAAKYAFNIMYKKYDIITRENWRDIKQLKDCIVFNCTPVSNIEIDSSCLLVDAIPTTVSGKIIAEYQSKEQLKIYLKNEP